MTRLRPADLAREHGLSSQSVRAYERDGVLPPARRTPAGHRSYTPLHAAALRAYRALAGAHGHATAREILRAVHGGNLDAALSVVDAAHAQLQRDRDTLHAVEASIGGLDPSILPARAGRPAGPLPIGALASRLGVSPATLRAWERAGILRPARVPPARQRLYTADDVRDAELASLLRRGGHPLPTVALVVEQVRSAAGSQELAASLAGWRSRLTVRGLAMLDAAGRLGEYVRLVDPERDLR